MRARFVRIRRVMHRTCLPPSCQELACLSSETRCSSSHFILILYYHVHFAMAGPLLPYYSFYIDCLLLRCIARAYSMHTDTQPTLLLVCFIFRKIPHWRYLVGLAWPFYVSEDSFGSNRRWKALSVQGVSANSFLV